jgi:alkanesulfonate monooxygenase SsuD/methylene tetrahydromethanopterin reductase-like flavin-dependent oxidoreductase (luciferase family)
MPSKTPKQARAMRAAAAAAGKSTLGIPPGVGREFVRADTKAKSKAPPPKPKPKP